MEKIISLFQRNYETDRLVREEVVESAEWVLAGEGQPTRKFDGTCCMVSDGKLWKRHDVRKGKNPPIEWVRAEPAPDPVTGHWPGWVPVGDEPDSRWHREAFEVSGGLRDGTYELVGPKIQGNPECFAAHTLIRHGLETSPNCPRDFEGIKNFLASGGWLKVEPFSIEGIVWHHPDGRMVKIKTRDFGLKR